eukprot:UN33532
MISRAIRTQNSRLEDFTGPNLCLQSMLEPSKFQCVLFEQTYNKRKADLDKEKSLNSTPLSPPSDEEVKSYHQMEKKCLY